MIDRAELSAMEDTMNYYKTTVITAITLGLVFIAHMSFAQDAVKPNPDMQKMIGTWEWKSEAFHLVVTYKWSWNENVNQLVWDHDMVKKPDVPYLEFPRYVCYEPEENKLYMYDFYSNGMWSQYKEIKREGDSIYFEIKLFNNTPPWPEMLYCKFTISDDSIMEEYSASLEDWKTLVVEPFKKVN
jgi:hypothetical protein